MTDDGFQAVGPRRKRKGRKVFVEKSVEDYVKDYEQRKLKLERSDYFDRFTEALKDQSIRKNHYRKVRCLALGQPTGRGGIPMLQLALLGILLDYLGLDHSACSHWDPEFDEKDISILEALGGTVQEQHEIEFPGTLVYMPHAPISLFEAVLARAGAAGQGCIIGNYAAMYHTSTAFDIKTDYPYLSKVVDELLDETKSDASWTATEIVEADKDSDWANAFNDLAIHVRHETD